MPFPDNVAFCCYALNGPYLVSHEPVQVMDGLSVSRNPGPVDLDDTWIRWLGTLQAETFRESDLIITAQSVRRDAYSHLGAREISSLEDRVRLFHWALVLLGCGYNSAALMVAGNTYDGHLHVGPISLEWTSCPRPEYRRYRRITEDDLRQAALILVGLEEIYSQVPSPNYRRLRKGFNSWIRGAQSQEGDQRLHSFVRAVEGVTRPTTTTIPSKRNRKGITTKFIERGQTFIGCSPRNERLLRQLYNLRSCVEHLKNILPLVHKPRGIHKDEAFAFRALESEILASTIYQRILSGEALRQRLRTEQSFEGFWRMRDDRRKKLWGETLDLKASMERQFQSRVIPDLL